MKIACWNVNSIRAREERLVAWLAANAPDAVCLQELKVTDDAFPYEAMRAAGYHAAVHGQKTYNGVAILSREEPRDVEKGLGDGADDPQARLVAATVGGIRLVCVYVPNGQTVGSEKWAYKLAWLERLRAWLDRRHRPEEPLMLLGDINVAPEPIDVANPDAWADSVLFHPEARAAWERVRAFGLVDLVRRLHPEERIYSWWDYRMLAFPRNDGLRIDHVLATEPVAARCASARVDREARKGKQPSDHAPLVVEIEA